MVERFERRGVKVTKQHNEEVQKLLKLMGIPIVLVCVRGLDLLDLRV